MLDDLENADCVFLIGGNPASNHPRLMTSLMHVRRRGGKVIVINPVRETGLVKFRIPSDPISLLRGTKIASHYVQPHIGGDLALLWGIAKATKKLKAIDTEFCNSTVEIRSSGSPPSMPSAGKRSKPSRGLPAVKSNRSPSVYADSQRTVFAWTMGITHHAHGVQNVQAIANLALCSWDGRSTGLRIDADPWTQQRAGNRYRSG